MLGCGSDNGETIDHNDAMDATTLQRQTAMLVEATREAERGNLIRARRLGDRANGLSRSRLFPGMQFRYDDPSTWQYISEDYPNPFTMAGYVEDRQRSAELAAAAMGLLVEMGRSGEYDFATALSSCPAMTVQKVAEEQVRRGQTKAAIEWASSLDNDRLRRYAEWGTLEGAGHDMVAKTGWDVMD
jgi:hypothetical protein